MSYCPYLFRGTVVTTKVLPGGVEPHEACASDRLIPRRAGPVIRQRNMTLEWAKVT